jgi:hypothetical protein
MPASIPRAALAALACLALAASAHGGSIFSCSDEKCSIKAATPFVKEVKTDGACTKAEAGGFFYKCTADSCSLFTATGLGDTCSINIGDLPVNKVTKGTGTANQAFFLYEDLTGAIVGGIIGGLAFLALIATWRFHATKTGPFAEGQTWVGFLTCKAARSGVVVGGK